MRNFIAILSLLIFFSCNPRGEDVNEFYSENVYLSLESALLDSKKVRLLDIYDSTLCSIPQEIVNLKNLGGLSINGSKCITGIPVEITSLDKLQILHISNTSISEMPNQLCQMKNLKYLRLVNNNFEEIPVCLPLMKLEELDMSFNYLTSVPRYIDQLKTIYSLDLSNNKLTVFPKEICELNNLQKLDLYGNNIDLIPAYIEKLYRTLTYLGLGNNQISEANLKELERLLPYTKIDTTTRTKENITHLRTKVRLKPYLEYGND